MLGIRRKQTQESKNQALRELVTARQHVDNHLFGPNQDGTPSISSEGIVDDLGISRASEEYRVALHKALKLGATNKEIYG